MCEVGRENLEGSMDGTEESKSIIQHVPILLSQANLLPKSAIHILAMAGIVDDNRIRVRIHFIDDAIIGNSKTIEMFRTLQF